MPEGIFTGFFLCRSIVPTWQKASAPSQKKQQYPSASSNYNRGMTPPVLSPILRPSCRPLKFALLGYVVQQG